MNSSTLAFNTHQFVKDLVEVNVPEDRAEALAEKYAAVFSVQTAAKADLELMQKYHETVANRPNTKIDDGENRIDVSFWMLLIVIAGLIIGANVLILIAIMQ